MLVAFRAPAVAKSAGENWAAERDFPGSTPWDFPITAVVQQLKQGRIEKPRVSVECASGQRGKERPRFRTSTDILEPQKAKYLC
jgi:hypothetical protein